MFCKFACSVTLFWSLLLACLGQPVYAATPLSRAVVQKLQNQVQLIPHNQAARKAKPSDVMQVGDALATAKASMAELRFNDGSIARLGERAMFRFVANTRTFHLTNGTALLLIRPGQGKTNLRTPNAAAGIRGSALFVRYIEGENITLIAALTNSDIEVFNQTASQQRTLKAGEMAVFERGDLKAVYEFDMQMFYLTSTLATDLDLTQVSPQVTDSLNEVRGEIVEALESQGNFPQEATIVNPTFIRSTISSHDSFPQNNLTVMEANLDRFDLPLGNQPKTAFDFKPTSSEVRSLLEVAEIQTRPPVTISPMLPPALSLDNSQTEINDRGRDMNRELRDRERDVNRELRDRERDMNRERDDREDDIFRSRHDR